MPNHITNTVTFTGNEDDIKAIRAMMDRTGNENGRAFDFNAVVPMPESLAKTPEQRAEYIATELRKAEQWDEYAGRQFTTATWVLETALEIGLREMERRLKAGEGVER